MGDSDDTPDSSNERLSGDSVKEKERRNKQKILADPSPDISADISNPSLGLMLEEAAEESQYAEWYSSDARQLEELLMGNLAATYLSAIKKIVERGYSREAAKLAIFNVGLCCGRDDVTGALTFLEMMENNLNTLDFSLFKGLEGLLEYTILEMINVLLVVRPNLTVTDAMWCLLISELNLFDACMVNGVPSGVSCGQRVPLERLTESKLKALCARNSDSNKLEDRRKSMPRGESSQPKTRDFWPVHHLSIYEYRGKASSLALEEAKGMFWGINRERIETPPAATTSNEKSGGSRKGSETYYKRDTLQPKAHPFKKKRDCSSKGVEKAKVATMGKMMLDNPSSEVMNENDLKFAPSAEIYGFTEDICNYLSSNPTLPAANSKAPASSVPDPITCPDGEASVSNPSESIDCLQKYVPQYDKEKSIQKLVPIKLELEKEVQGWTVWANEKVMQVTRRLQKNQGELKMLRLEKKKTVFLENERQTSMSEMKRALLDIPAQIDVSKKRVRQLEEENLVLAKEMEAAKSWELESATKLQGAIAREQMTWRKTQLLNVEKVSLQEQLSDLKYRVTELDSQIEKAKKRQDQFKVLLKHEQKERERAAMQVDALRRKREEDDALMKAEEDKIKQRAETNMRKCKEDIKKLENMISGLRLETSKSNIAAPNLTNIGIDSVTRERECVVCMSEEFSVVFLPCAHQVLCVKCNELHETKGMNDCPSCRTVIQKRVLVHYRDD